MAPPFTGKLEARPFTVSVPNEALEELQQLLKLAKIGPATFENTTAADSSYGVSRAWTQEAREYWMTKYDWYILSPTKLP